MENFITAWFAQMITEKLQEQQLHKQLEVDGKRVGE